jgi:sugar phosphate isomerase/epimerase
MKNIVIAICALVTVSCSAQKNKPLFDMPLGVQSYTYRASFPNGVAATLDSVKALGITEMEGPNPKNTGPEEFKKMLNERGISMPSIGLDYNIVATTPLEAVKLAKIFGSKYVMVAWIPHGNTFTIDEAKKAVADFNTAGKVLQENGITLCYHNHGYEFGPYEAGTLFDYIVKNTDPKYVSFEMDMLWAFHGGANPAKLLLQYPTR